RRSPDLYPADGEQQAESCRTDDRTQPVRGGDAGLAAESRAEDAPVRAEQVAERQRAEYHDDERRPDRTVEQQRSHAHDAERKNEQDDGNADGERAEPFAHERGTGHGAQLARMVGHVVHRAPAESFRSEEHTSELQSRFDL